MLYVTILLRIHKGSGCMGKQVYLTDKEIEVINSLYRLVEPHDEDIEIVEKLVEKVNRK